MTQELDVFSFRETDTARLYIKNPRTGIETATYVDLLGESHDTRAKLNAARSKALRDAYAATGSAPDKTDKERYDDDTEYLIEITAGWNIKRAGVDLPLTKETARQVYCDKSMNWLREQVKDGLKNSRLFIVPA